MAEEKDGPFKGWTVSVEANNRLNLAAKMEEKGMSEDRISTAIDKAAQFEAAELAKS